MAWHKVSHIRITKESTKISHDYSKQKNACRLTFCASKMQYKYVIYALETCISNSENPDITDGGKMHWNGFAMCRWNVSYRQSDEFSCDFPTNSSMQSHIVYFNLF